MENAVVNLVICGCILFAKASHFYNCSGCVHEPNKNPNRKDYNCDVCNKSDHSDTCNDKEDSSSSVDCSKICPLVTTVCNSNESQTSVTVPTTTSTNNFIQTPAYKVVEKQNIEECPSGDIAGSVVGGALFGSLVTVLIFMLHHHRQKKSIRNPVPKAIQNPSYQTEMVRINERAVEEDTGKSMYSEINDEKSIKESRVPPIWKNGNIHENKDGVYNTLNETNTVNRSEYYDHAKPGASLSTPTDGYGTVKLEYDHVRPGASVSPPSDGYGNATVDYGGNNKHPMDDNLVVDKDRSSKENKTDEYFVLEKLQ